MAAVMIRAQASVRESTGDVKRRDRRGDERFACAVTFLSNRVPVNLIAKLRQAFGTRAEPEHLRRGRLGERAARRHLQEQGLKFLAANFRSPRGEIDLIFREKDRGGTLARLFSDTSDCLVFVEVKTRSSEEWTRPAAAVDARKRRLLSQCALDYLKLCKNPRVKFRFDIVEVLLRDGEVREVRHLPNAFALTGPYRYG
jgi:putative endonuclease